uniref:Uncharacterized protein n=1 Tax=Arundo donax TaxID=35708 RepID=A0A0A8Y1C1_ARUDO
MNHKTYHGHNKNCSNGKYNIYRPSSVPFVRISEYHIPLESVLENFDTHKLWY